MRTEYRNGDSITLTATGCDSCSPCMVNGVLCHESGCPDAWRDMLATCWECGYEFYPDTKPTKYSVCPDCCGN